MGAWGLEGVRVGGRWLACAVRGVELASSKGCGGCGGGEGEGSTRALFASAATAAVKLKKALGTLSASKAVS